MQHAYMLTFTWTHTGTRTHTTRHAGEDMGTYMLNNTLNTHTNIIEYRKIHIQTHTHIYHIIMTSAFTHTGIHESHKKHSHTSLTHTSHSYTPSNTHIQSHPGPFICHFRVVRGSWPALKRDGGGLVQKLNPECSQMRQNIFIKQHSQSRNLKQEAFASLGRHYSFQFELCFFSFICLRFCMWVY